MIGRRTTVPRTKRRGKTRRDGGPNQRDLLKGISNGLQMELDALVPPMGPEQSKAERELPAPRERTSEKTQQKEAIRRKGTRNAKFERNGWNRPRKKAHSQDIVIGEND
jgi:hypothetical protein